MDYSCPICYYPFGTGKKAPIKTPCNHVFCIECMQDMVRRSGASLECPTCRRSLKNFRPTQSMVDKSLQKHYQEITDKRIAAGLATPPGQSSLDLFNNSTIKSAAALTLLAEHQRRNGLRPLRNIRVTKIETATVYQFAVQTFCEQRECAWKAGAGGSKAEADAKSSGPKPRGVAAVWGDEVQELFSAQNTPHFTTGEAEANLPRAVDLKSDAAPRHMVVRRTFSVRSNAGFSGQQTLFVDNLDEQVPKGRPSWITTAPTIAKSLDHVKDGALRDALVTAIDAQAKACRDQQQRRIAVRHTVSRVNIARVDTAWSGGTGFRFFCFQVLRAQGINAGGGRPSQSSNSRVWFDQYPEQAACCSIM